MINSENEKEPVWRRQRRLSRAYLPAHLRPWLLDTGSLTQRIIGACSKKFRVEVVRQGWVRPMRNEARALGLRPEAYALVREVRLFCGDAPWVYARTVIPRATLSGIERRLAWLRSRSLGAMLFADPSVERGEFELVQLVPGDRLYERTATLLAQRPPMIWGRRARFRLKGKALLVSEIFLPALGTFPAR